MDRPEFTELQRIFDAALDLPVAERAAFLDEQCGADLRLRARLERMLATSDDSIVLPGLSGAIEEAMGNAGEEALKRAVTDWEEDPLALAPAPEQIGQFRVARRLGHGGMGAVYLAERAGADFTQRVAVKVVRPGWDSPDVMRRFLAERRILAQLEHPAIARFIDGGVTEAGQPYFAMEYVEGIPIDQYSDEQRLDVRSRLRLFLDACAAVQYAHQTFVVHRDLKPSNILVTPDGALKLLDFGIATVLAGGETAGNTLFGAGVGTPFYMSPEQFRAEPITAATDVYSLGILLFELLTGTVPYRLTSSHPRDIEHAVLTLDPERPSTALGRPNPRTGDERDDAGIEEVSARRRSIPARLRRTLRGELDAVLLKALDKEPGRRYASVQALADDLSRYLAGHPVRARPASSAYRLSRTARRHPWGTAAALGIAALLIGYVATLSVQNARVGRALALAEQEAGKSSAVSSFLLGLFRESNPGFNLGDPLTAAQLLERGAEQAESMEDPNVKSELFHVLGRTYRSRGQYDDALALMGRALELRKGPPPASDQDLGASLDDYASILQDLGRYDEAEQIFLEALEVRARLGPDHEDHIETLNNLGVFYTGLGDLEAAEPLARKTFEARTRIYEPGHPRIGVALNNLASLLDRLERRAEAEALFREALDNWTRSLGPDHPDIALVMSNLGLTLDARGEFEEAESLHRQSLAIRQNVYPEGHYTTAVSMNNLAASLESSAGSAPEALSLRRQATGLMESTLGPGHPFTLRSRGLLGVVLAEDWGEAQEGEALLRDTIARMADEDAAAKARLHQSLGGLLEARGDLAEARPHLQAAVRLYEEGLGPTHSATQSAKSELARVLGSSP